MNTELRSSEHRNQRLIGWGITYIIIVLLALAGLLYIASLIRTQTLPVGQIQLIVPHSQYLVGEPITFEIKNNLNANIYVQNKCPTEPLDVYMKQSGTWVRIHDAANINDCSREQRQVAIAANSTLTSNFTAWPNLFSQPGQYRIVAVVEHYNALPYQDFEVISVPAPKPAPAAPVQNTQRTTTPATPTQIRQFREQNDD